MYDHELSSYQRVSNTTCNSTLHLLVLLLHAIIPCLAAYIQSLIFGTAIPTSFNIYNP